MRGCVKHHRKIPKVLAHSLDLSFCPEAFLTLRNFCCLEMLEMRNNFIFQLNKLLKFFLKRKANTLSHISFAISYLSQLKEAN